MAKQVKKKKELSKLKRVWLVSDSPKGKLEQDFEWDHAERILRKTGNKAPSWRLKSSQHLEFKDNALRHKPSQETSGESEESTDNK